MDFQMPKGAMEELLNRLRGNYSPGQGHWLEQARGGSMARREQAPGRSMPTPLMDGSRERFSDLGEAPTLSPTPVSGGNLMPEPGGYMSRREQIPEWRRPTDNRYVGVPRNDTDVAINAPNPVMDKTTETKMSGADLSNYKMPQMNQEALLNILKQLRGGM